MAWRKQEHGVILRINATVGEHNIVIQVQFCVTAYK